MNEDLIRKLAAGKLFRSVSLGQLGIHLCAYIAAFVKLIIIDAGGYYDASILRFLAITAGSMPLFAIEWWLIQNSLKISKSKRAWGYYLNFGICLWSIGTIVISYFV
ncbi:hypothetical protein [Chamaesiphon polymorphus]|uniref:Uncharacterized protein n=1 Tax=Chamaesiphon polymorphus CCALA 037 TaxID=2107692 RepID=A0A2T1GK23_9CYAN|nr:hypothetical protein [Chamaesiphon polymorphus]PSB58182.1 hypothetical protein C7B77_05755 [Chamaesiphon polymorphus CCALA 037]